FQGCTRGRSLLSAGSGPSTNQGITTRTANTDRAGHQRSDASAIFAILASWQLDPSSLFGGAVALADNIVRWLFFDGACKCDDLGVACHLCSLSVRSDFSYSGA